MTNARRALVISDLTTPVAMREAVRSIFSRRPSEKNSAPFLALRHLGYVVLVSGFCAGCVMGDPPPFEAVDAVVVRSGSDVLLLLPTEFDPKRIEVLDLSVLTMAAPFDGALPEAVWRLRRRTSQVGRVGAVEWPIKYGTRLGDMDVEIPAKPLSPGKYRFSVHAYVYQQSAKRLESFFPDRYLAMIRGEFIQPIGPNPTM